MTTLPTSPFPELRPLEQSRQVPSLADLLSNKTGLPVQTTPPAEPPRPAPAPSKIPLPTRPPLRVTRLPAAPSPAASTVAPPGRLAAMPVATSRAADAGEPTSPASFAEYMATPDPAPLPLHDRPGAMPTAGADPGEPESPEATAPDTPAPVDSAPAGDIPPAARSSRHAPPTGPLPAARQSTTPPPATDEDLKDALLPILEDTLDQALRTPKSGLYTHLEPMLRSTVRRAIAEQMQTSGQFRHIRAADRIAWRLNALFTSRSYEEIVFERTRRYQVEELFLLRKSSHTLISHASHDPARHASVRRVEPTVEMLVSRLFDSDGELQPSFELPERCLALVRSGRHALLVTVLRGSSNALVRADLDYILRQAEDRYDGLLEEETDNFMHALQPILEGGLLIQSPAPPR